MYQEDVYEEMIKDPFFEDYRPEQCQQNLAMLVEWKNLNTIQDGYTDQPKEIIARAGMVNLYLPPKSVTLLHHKDKIS